MIEIFLNVNGDVAKVAQMENNDVNLDDIVKACETHAWQLDGITVLEAYVEPWSIGTINVEVFDGTNEFTLEYTFQGA